MPDDPNYRLLWLLGQIADGNLNQHDYAIRRWGAFDPMAAKAVRRVDENRLAYVRELFLDMGFTDCDADLRSRMSYYYVIGEQVAGLDQTPQSRGMHTVARHSLLTDMRLMSTE